MNEGHDSIASSVGTVVRLSLIFSRYGHLFARCCMFEATNEEALLEKIRKHTVVKVQESPLKLDESSLARIREILLDRAICRVFTQTSVSVSQGKLRACLCQTPPIQSFTSYTHSSLLISLSKAFSQKWKERRNNFTSSALQESHRKISSCCFISSIQRTA